MEYINKLYVLLCIQCLILHKYFVVIKKSVLFFTNLIVTGVHLNEPDNYE